MTIHQIQFHFNKQYLVRISQVGLLLLSIMLASPASAQITVGGNVYGGGNKGAMTSTDASAANVTIKAGTITGKVFGGARQAAIAGGTHVILDGEKASANIIIGEVYGGNDVAGTVSGTATVETTYRADNAEDATQNARIYVTNLYGGGNGDYDYTSKKNDAGEETNELADLTAPDIANTVINITSGCYNQVFAGGNSATVTSSASITLDNSTKALKKLVRNADGTVTETDLTYQFDRVFGGNNKVAMDIRPTWHLNMASINNLYSGGNAGDMTHPNGILLAVTGSGMTINNVYGGCRMANVNPDGNKITSETIEDVAFPSGYAARTLIKGGKINNVYGGNDISGNVYGGCALEIQSSILNDVYGGGNGSYAYANNTDWQTANPTESDLFYTGNLYDHRPNAESVYLHVIGTETAPTYIGGSLYCGGNSATLTGTSDNSAQLEIGSYVVADKVFLGSNGENMVTEDMLAAMNARNTFNLTQSADFKEYMRGVEVNIKPIVAFDKDYIAYSTKFGSLYCGGNVGSMSASGQFTINFLNSLVIYDKIVGGCNNANVAKSDNNAFHLGGLTTAMTNDDPKVLLNISGVKLEPRYLEKTTNDDGTTTFSLKWNKDAAITDALKGANVYGGCYESGYINGKVQINVTADAISENVFKTEGTDLSGANYVTMLDNPLVSTMSVYGGGYGKKTEIWGDVAVNVTNNAHILKVYGGGELGYVGKMTRNDDGVMQNTVATAYGTNVTLNATAPTGTDFAALNAAKIYGGGFKGDVTGNTHVDLGQGRVYNAFGGACNADIFGGAEIYVGQTSVPEVTNNIYAANDFGGQITGSLAHSAQYDAARYQTVRSNAYLEYYDAKITGDVFGGPCGSYDYTTTYVGKFTSLPTLLTAVTKNASDAFTANTFVNVLANNYTNKVTNIFGGGQGFKGSMDNADINSSYVLLHSQGSSQLADNVYGAGDCSLTKNSLVDAYTGLFGTIFGGCHGVSLEETIHQEKADELTYMGDNSEVALWDGMTNTQMDVYGAGAYSGTKESKVTLNGGSVKDVYGASFNQGITYMATVEVPSTSTAHVNAIFGGGRGEGENSQYPCDTFNSFINYNSANSSVEDAIYGGNFACRFTRSSYVNINVPVKNAEGELIDIYGAGYGPYTVAQYTKVNLNSGASVKNVYGGGRNGMVCDMPSMEKYMEGDYFGKQTTESDYPYDFGYATFDKEIIDYNDWFRKKGSTVNGETIYGLIAEPEPAIRNTQVLIKEGALVTINAYGGGLGRSATVSGATGIDLLGGTVTNDIYGGGYGGNVAAFSDVKTNPSTNVHIQGGNVRNVYGGGLNGHVNGTANTVVGTPDQDAPTFANGLPTIERSLYGGGEKGHVEGWAKLTINNGYVGYKYEDGNFEENLDYKTSGDNILSENGNAFGGGYGEGAYVDSTEVTLYGGTIRNGLYGGGEIAAIGRGDASKTNGTPNGQYTFSKGGETHIYMFNGHVEGDVFGGGRGFSYDKTGNEVTGKSLYSDGYVFGTTDVNIYGGEIGTETNIADGHGNVFGGGNIGYVYSVNGKKESDGYYYSSGKLTEDTRVIVSPYTKVTADAGITINNVTYAKNDYVPTSALDLLRNKNADATEWAKLDLTGINIRNAVFAGGNVSSGSDKVYANATTVFGNATATLNDVFYRDLITIGTEHTGGLYGDGNLTFVDGYRELNITNYGTDYYGMSDNITIEQYHALSDRERAYFELKYKCLNNHEYDNHGTKVSYVKNQSISQDDYNAMTDEEKANWVEAGFCSIYAGRLLNTIQRADFCGVFGSRMVLQGAQDRVPSVVDYTEYTINRVGEVSLNKKEFAGDRTGVTETDELTHGNYFGMYNVVNYLGALTSDVDFDDERTTDNGSYLPESTDQTYLDWKSKYYSQNKRNTGSCHNKVALASGVFLELVKEPAEGSTSTEKEYGPINGVVELDLINVMAGLGGGYVYAKNVHGTRTKNSNAYSNLSAYNANAINQSKYTYSESELHPYETSGNFINDLKQIVDECYPNKDSYQGADASPAHYWFIKGQIYVYDQYISAYTGAAQAYDQTMLLPLSLSGGASGRLSLLNIKPQYYAYWYDRSSSKKLGTDAKSLSVEVNKKTYKLNDIITYWEYMQLSDADKAHFVDKTYVIAQDYRTSKESTETMVAGSQVYLPSEIEERLKSNETVYDPSLDKMVPLSDVIRLSNGLTHSNGYALSVSLDNPSAWDAYYTKSGTGTEKKTATEYNALNSSEQNNYIDAPTYKVKTEESGVYGQREYAQGDIVNGSVIDAYEALSDHKPSTDDQAKVQRAYVAITEAEYTISGKKYTTQAGTAISAGDYSQTGSEMNKFGKAVICTNTLQYGTSQDDYIYYGELITEDRLDEIAQTLSSATGTEGTAGYKSKADMLKELQENYFEDAYICTEAGKYGGKYFEAGQNYSTLSSWADLSADDRKHFEFNYDALDVILHDNYPATGAVGSVYPYDKDNTTANALYARTEPVDYTATFVGWKDSEGNTETSFTYNGKEYKTGQDPLTREEYEALPNDQKNFAAVVVADKYTVNTPFGDYKINQEITKEAYDNLSDTEKKLVDTPSTDYYIVKVAFIRGEVPYVVGQTVSKSLYESMEATQKANVDVLSRDKFSAEGTYYYCRNAFTSTTGISVLGASAATTSLSLGDLITSAQYQTLPNYQRGFSIDGKSPNETTRLFVSRESDIKDMTKDRIVTLVYQYNYEESDVSMTNIENISERHILNIHITFKSGVPTIDKLQDPSIILPGSTIGLKQPAVTPGAYEIIGGGWEIYNNQKDAERHTNGAKYTNNATPMYWYQNGYWAAYYAKTYLGKTYSNPVQFKVANYHDIADVMADTQNSMYIGHTDVDRAPKIYISNDNTADGTKSELDLLKDLYDRTLTTKNVQVQSKNDSGQSLYYAVDESGNKLETTTTTVSDYPVTHSETVYAYDNVYGCKNLDFILTDDVKPTAYTTWISLGEGQHSDPNGTIVDNPCFGGNVHAIGHTISGLSNSLFKDLCGNVYNLGVTGSFSSAGIADAGTGYVENCWVKTTSTDDAMKNVYAVFGSPSRTGDKNLVQIKNCYYPETNGYKTSATTPAHGIAKAMPEKSFYNGEVAYDLNGFYLNKRYSDKKVTSGTDYKYYTINAGDNTKLDIHTAKYETMEYQYPVVENGAKNLNYVEYYVADGDFIYAKGTIPEETDERWNVEDGKYYPIYPDDYIFFGQMLTYGYVDGNNYTYQTQPSRINKQENLRLRTTDFSNRVFRAPAYFMSKTMDKAYFNYKAVFADMSTAETGNKEAYTDMTAIDFTGSGDKAAASGWQAAVSGTNVECFYPPFLDYDRLKGYQSNGLTQNMLVYAGTVDAASYKVLDDYLYEPAITQGDYGTVAKVETSNVHGHLVDLTGGVYVASRNHLLVDKQNFNAPISYTFNKGQYMWYQRTPELFADGAKGWETICLPFTADLVATHQKGEITHFYGATKDNAIGHEYWLRGLKTVTTANNTTTAAFIRPMAGSSDAGYDSRYEHIDNTVDNSFLWDYYYSKNSYDDKNQDDYQNYWNNERTYSDYPLYTAKVPYLISFPGENFYEYDMSGNFVPQNTYQAIAQLDKQTVSFVSKANQEIAVSDGEDRTTTVDGYKFRGFYQASDFAANEYYALDATGAEFDMGTAAGKAVPFRAYFRTTDANAKTRTILIGEDASYIDSPESALADGTIQAYGQHRMLHIISHLDSDIMLPVYTMQGQLVQMVDLKAGAHEQLSLAGGIYIVHGQKVVVTK